MPAHFSTPSIHDANRISASAQHYGGDNSCGSYSRLSLWFDGHELNLAVFFPIGRAAYVEALAEAINGANDVPLVHVQDCDPLRGLRMDSADMGEV